MLENGSPADTGTGHGLEDPSWSLASCLRFLNTNATISEKRTHGPFGGKRIAGVGVFSFQYKEFDEMQSTKQYFTPETRVKARPQKQQQHRHEQQPNNTAYAATGSNVRLF